MIGTKPGTVRLTRRLARATLSVAMLLMAQWPSYATAQTTNTPEDEYKKLIKVNEDIQPLGDTPFGERISLYDGSLSFNQTDVTVTGTGPTITVSREFSMHGVEDRPDLQYRAFGDWDMALPQIFTVTANQNNVDGWQVAAVTNHNAICSSFGPPPSVAAPTGDSLRADWEPETWWQGYQLRIPGQGNQDLLGRSTANTTTPGVNGLAYPIVTRSNWAVGCLPQASNDATREGFLAVSPDGTKYWLDHLAYRYMPSLTRPLGSGPMTRSVLSPQASAEDFVTRREGRMLVTRIEDRFGNSVTYSYSGDDVTDISASDGRHVTLAYEPDATTGASSHRVSTVTVQGGNAGTRTWTYSYVKSAANLVYTLTAVAQPDGSAWGYNLDPLNRAWPDSRESGGTCEAIGEPSNIASSFTATMTHPSGLSASYTVVPLKRGRSYVYQTCMAGPNIQILPNLSGTWAAVPNASYSMAITQRVLTGAGLPANGLTWSYAYSPSNESWAQDCNTTACASSIYTDVTYPADTTHLAGHVERSTFSNRYDWTESQLQREDVYDGATDAAIRRTTTYSYVNPDPAVDARAGAYVHPWGYTPQERVNVAQLQDQLPMATRTTVVDPTANATPDTYTWNATAFDAFARAQDVTRASNFGFSVSERSTFTDNPALWVIGLPSQSVNLTLGETVSQMNYDATTSTPTERYRFGTKVMDYTFNPQGQLASFTDGNGKTTTLGGYVLGIPGSIAYPDATSQVIGVDGFGQIASITDQAKATTSYGYDAIGRIARIDYPSGDSVAWAPKTYTYSYVADGRGLGGAHWVRSTKQGTLTQQTDFDALLRPVMTGKSEADTGALYVSTRTEYDWAGRKTFESFPVDGAPDRSAITQGSTTVYDVLGRPVSTTVPSEQGDLTTTMAYPAGGARSVTDARVPTNPGDNVTTSYFQAFDEPSMDAAVRVVAPEGVTQDIARDLYGNVLSITQGGVARTMTYDAEHRLCRSWEPETGSTMTSYDAADNVVWSATGQAFNGTGCGYDQVADTDKTASAYDGMNRVTSVTYPSGTLATSFTYDALGKPATAVSATSTASANNTGTVGWAFGRNKLGLLTAEVLSVDGWSWGLGYGYDANGNLSAVQYPDNQTMAVASNALGQATAVGTYATAGSYFPDGELKSYALGNGALYSATKNARNLLSNFSFGTASSVAISEDLGYDRVGNILSITDQSGSTQRTRTMSYDWLNRLTMATASNLWGSESYTYDTLNNIRSLTDSTGTNTYNYDANNLLASITAGGGTAHSFAYDVRGNTVTKDTQAMTFDLANRLLAVTGKGEYMYDATGHRVKSVTPTGTTYYAYASSGQLMWEYDNGTATGTSYIYLGKKLVAARKASTSTVLGTIEGVSTGANATITGWACASGLATSIDVHLYVGTPTESGVQIGTFTANLASEQAIQDACHSSGTLHRFSIPLTEAMRADHAGGSIYVFGISPSGGANNPLTGSGTLLVPPSTLAPVAPASATTAVSADLSTLTVSWAASANVTSYTLERSWNGEPWPEVYNGTATSVSLPVAVDGSYVFRVKACNANGCSEPTVSNTVTVAHVPPAPASIVAPPTSTGAVALSWDAAPYATSYGVEHSQDGNWTQVASVAATTATISEPVTGNWYYRVRACNANGCSGYVTSGVVIVTLPPVDAPPISGGGTSNTGAYTIAWSGVAGATSYNLMESANGGALTTVQNDGNGSWSTSGRGDGTYVYQVQGCNAGGCGPFSGQIAVTVSLIPATPSQPSVTQTNPDYKPVVHVTWTAVAGATRYEVLEQPDSGAASTVYSGTNLTWGELKYYSGALNYSVRACNDVGCSAYSVSNGIILSSGG
jgi:YD repeat-containing protein